MKKISLKIIVLLIVMFIGIGIVDAASFSVSVGSRNLSKGNTTKLTIKGSDVTGRFNISTSNASVVSISEDRAWIENDSYTITLSALSVGTSTITITPSGVSDGSGNKASLAPKTINVTVSLPREKSNDNALKSLTVEGFEISPEFNKDTLDYTVDVPEGTKSIKVSANPNSKYASVTGTGEIDVTEGVNNLSIVVKAETGKERIYNLIVNVIDQNPINVTVNNKNYTIIKLRENFICPDSFVENNIVIDNFQIPSCINDKINYTLVGLKTEDGLVESYIYDNGRYIKYSEIISPVLRIIHEKYDGQIEGLKESTLKIDDTNYQVFKFSDKSQFAIIYGKNILNGENSFYIYDIKNKTFSTYDTEYIDYLKEQNKTFIYVIIAFGCGLFLSIICIIILSRKKRNKKKNLVDNKEEVINSKNKKDKKKEVAEEIKEDINKVEEISDTTNIDNTETYYLFEKDKNKKKKIKEK